MRSALESAETEVLQVNGLKTVMLLSALTALFMALGYTLGGPSGAVIALLVAAGLNLFPFWNADKIVLKMNHAPGVDESGRASCRERVCPDGVSSVVAGSLKKKKKE